MLYTGEEPPMRARPNPLGGEGLLLSIRLDFPNEYNRCKITNTSLLFLELFISQVETTNTMPIFPFPTPFGLPSVGSGRVA